MFIVIADFKGVVPKSHRIDILLGTRVAGFGAISEDVVEKNELKFDDDCIAVYLNLGLVGKTLGLLTSGKFPDLLAAILFSAKDAYIPHDASLIAGIATAVGKYLGSCGLIKGAKAAAWAMPLVLGKWVAVPA